MKEENAGTQIFVYKTTKEKLKDTKIIKRESYDSVINRLLKRNKLVEKLINDLRYQRILKEDYTGFFVVK